MKDNLIFKMGSTKRSWHDIATEKRHAQAECIARFVQGGGRPRQELPIGGLASIEGQEIGDSLYRKDYTCEALTTSFIQRFVQKRVPMKIIYLRRETNGFARACEIHKSVSDCIPREDS